MESQDDELTENLIYDYRLGRMDAADRLLCDYAVKLTLTPGLMNEGDVENLRRGGFDDAQITIANQVISYFNYINRVADGLGVDDETWMSPTKEQWLARKASDYDPK